MLTKESILDQIVIYTIQGPVVIYALFMAAKIMSLYSITKGKVKSRSKNGGDLRLKMPRFSEVKKLTS